MNAAAESGTNPDVGAADAPGSRDVRADTTADAPGAAHGVDARAPDATLASALAGAPAGTLHPRHVRSYSGRRGHCTSGQRQAYETLREVYGIAYRAAPLDLAAAFGRDAPTVLEIGFGMGETTAAIAAADPARNYLGVEVYPAGVGSLLARVQAQALSNVRIVQHDAVEVLRDMIAPGALAAVHLYFPDPWPKKRHHKRRLVQSPLVSLVASRLAPCGVLHCATDWQPYAEQMLAVLSAEKLLENTAEGYAPRPEWRPLTKFERRGLALGHGVWDLVFTRR